MSPALTPEEQNQIERFEVWLTKFLNAKGWIYTKPMAFSARTSINQFGAITIDSGRMMLFIEPGLGRKFYKLVETGTHRVIAANESLIWVLIDGLKFSIERHFAEHYQP